MEGKYAAPNMMNKPRQIEQETWEQVSRIIVGTKKPVGTEVLENDPHVTGICRLLQLHTELMAERELQLGLIPVKRR